MPVLAFILVVLLSVPLAVARAGEPSVSAENGNIVYRDSTSETHRITDKGVDSDPVLSPDGTLIAFIRKEGSAVEEGEPDRTALLVFDIGKGSAARVIAPHPAGAVEEAFESIAHPVFSLDGHFVYVLAEAWATSAAVHQVNLRTHTERFVIDGNSLALIRTGPYRGYLLVSRHRYWPEGGSYNPVYVVRPDAKETFMVPGTQAEDGADHVGEWLRKNGWTAW
jgi:dipeptidyl aminopeptidase/acylaminoacyl peptidase